MARQTARRGLGASPSRDPPRRGTPVASNSHGGGRRDMRSRGGSSHGLRHAASENVRERSRESMSKAGPGGARANPRVEARSADQRTSRATSSFPVVGVGASAGGLEAFRQLLAHVPANAGLALVLVQHLEPKRASLLSDALGRATGMAVAQAEDGVRVEPNRVYVIPPGAQMAIEKGILRALSAQRRRAEAPPAHRPLPPVAGRRPRQAIHRCGPLRNRVGRDRGAGGDPGARGDHVRAGPPVRPLRRDAPERD